MDSYLAARSAGCTLFLTPEQRTGGAGRPARSDARLFGIEERREGALSIGEQTLIEERFEGHGIGACSLVDRWNWTHWSGVNPRRWKLKHTAKRFFAQD